MWLLMVTTFAAAVFADDGYHYNAPNIPFGLPSNQPANVRPIHVLPENNIKIGQDNKVKDTLLSHSVSYKDCVFLKKVANSNGFVQQLNSNYNNLYINHHGNNGGLLVSHNVQNNLGGLLNNGYAGFVQSTNNNNVYSYVSHGDHTTTTPVTEGASVGYTHSIPLYTNNNVIVRYVQPKQLFRANIYNQLPINILRNTEYKTVSVPNNIDYHSQPIIPTGEHHFNNGYLHSATANQAAQTTGSLNSACNHNKAYSHVTQVSASLHGTYSPVAQIKVPDHDGHSQVKTSSAEVNLNSGYAPLHPSPTFNPYNENYQFVPPPDSSTINFAYNNVAPEKHKLIDGYEQKLASSSSSQVNTGYKQSSSTEASISTVLTSSQTPTVSGSSSKEYSETATGPSHVDFNASITQLSTSFATAASSSLISEAVTSNDAPADNGLVQNNLVRAAAVNSIPVAAPISPPVTPIIHKHVYFHVPPLDLEEPQQVIPLPPAPKKNYKILFIKVPSQEFNTNVANLQQQKAQLQNAAVEDRTLIYLLVKTPQDPTPVDLPEPKLSKHQVFFVQYNASPFEIASQVSEELDKTGSVKSIVPLEPGLINGQHK